MRKEQKRAILDLLKSLHQVHEEIRKALEQKNFILAQNMISEAQESAILLGENIEKTEGEGHRTVSNIEEYCELLFTVFEAINKNDFNPNKVYKILRKQLIKIENSVKNDIIVRMEIVFFPYKVSMWDSLESIYLAAKEDPECDAYCVPIPYFDVNQDHSLGQMHYEGGEYPEDIEVIDWQKYNLEERRPDVIYIHNPYDAWNLVTSVHPRYYSFNLKKYTDTLVYVPYYVTSGGMMEAQGSLPSYQYVDYIVIQSPQFRGYFDPKIPKEKFLPFGSPKIDRVIRKCQNPPEPPAEWSSKMTGRDGGRKRVIFYNTGINAMLKDTETFFKKMAYVFQCFIGREDVCLLWRPHPLLESTLDSMRLEFRPVYDGLKERFLTEQLGIYDTTSDIEESIALSDAYIGDAGTSVTALFGVTGKPIFILNDRILEEPGENDWRKELPVGFDYQEPGNRFNILQGNKLYVSEPYRYDYRYFCDLMEGDYDNHYLSTYEMNGKWYACPTTAQDILIIGEKGVEKKIELKKMAGIGTAFYFSRKADPYIFLLPINYPAIVRYDTVTGKIRYFTEHIDVFIKEKDGQKITGGSLVYQGVLYAASPTDNKLYKLDIESGESTAIELPIKSRCGGHVLAEYRGMIWFTPYDGQVIVCWNPDTNEVREYEGFPEGFRCKNPANDSECMEKSFCTPAFHGKYMYIPSCWSNMCLQLDIDTGEFERWVPPYMCATFSKVFELENGIETSLEYNDNAMFLYWKPDEREKCFKMYSFSGHKFYKIFFEENDFQEAEIKFDRKELEDNEPGFRKYSESLPYACIENYFNTLGRFLNGKTVGNQFQKERQIAAYKGIIVNCDGECGENTRICKKQNDVRKREELLMKLFIWGTGRLSGKVVGVHVKEEDIVGFIDNDDKKFYMDRPVFRPSEMIGKEYDAILVANLYRESIHKQCEELGIDLKRVIFLYNNCALTDVNKNYDFVTDILGEGYAETVRTRYHIVRGTEVYGKRYECAISDAGYKETDYVRMETFELVVKELRKREIKGNVAEAGVFRGEFAQYINAAFPDKKLYLFDTFDGFNASEALNEIKNGNCTEAFAEAYKDTNIQQVLDRMPHLDALIIKQGIFPDSLQGLEDEFCFVSIDMDFEESIYQGLVYFYPRLVGGGYIFVHDYNSSLRGVEKAVDRYEKDFSVMLHKVPLCDANGSLVITK